MISMHTSLESRRVQVVEKSSPSRADWHRCEIGANLLISPETLKSYCFAPWEPVIFDAFLTVAAVEFCDRKFGRPTHTWGRRFHLAVPVHDPERWNSPNLASALHEALKMLTGDDWHVEFTSRCVPAVQPIQSQLPLPSDAWAVIPYSDGLDSQAVAAIAGRPHGLLRVRLAPKPINSRKLKRASLPFTAIPYQVRAAKNELVETSNRSRGFKFATISGIAAYLAKVGRVVLPESGQGALGPALVLVGQAYPDYRNHPRFTRIMERFIAALLDYRIQYEFPRLWHTKAETLRAYVEQGNGADSWMHTRSCWQSRRQISVDHKQRQCGICAACMLRRMSVHAAGLQESRETYAWEDLSAATFKAGAAPRFTKITDALREYAIAGTLHMDELARLRNSPLHAQGMKRHSRELGEWLHISTDDAEKRLHRLLGQHELEWRAFLESVGPVSFIKQWVQEVK